MVEVSRVARLIALPAVALAAAASVLAMAPAATASPVAATAASGLPAGAATSAAAGRPGRYLTAVSCASKKDCVAVGQTMTAGGKPTPPLAESWNGTRWKLLPVPLPAGGTGGNLADVSCPSATSCFAVGSYTYGSAGQASLAEAWNGRSWKAVKLAAPAGESFPTLISVSCASARSCMALGSYSTASGGSVAFSERWTGARWIAGKVQLPKGGFGVIVGGVSCVSAAACKGAIADVSVGKGGALSQVSLIESWNGKAWSAIALPLGTAQSLAAPAGVSCPTATDCVALASYFNRSWFTQAAVFNGRKWTVTTIPGRGVALGAIACSSAKSCIAAGSQGQDAYGHDGRPYVATWNGKSWKGTTIPAPPAPKTSSYVSGNFAAGAVCPSPAACVAVGVAHTATWPPAGFSDVWNGKAWKMVPLA
jgi:hypothetical protein